MQIPHYFEDLDHLHINTEPDRAYYIPASRAGNYFLDREKSDRFFLLSGIWRFRYFQSVYGSLEISEAGGTGKRMEERDSTGRMAKLWRRLQSVYQYKVSIPCRSPLCSQGKSVRTL